MNATADSKVFTGKGFTHFVAHDNGSVVFGANGEAGAKADADDRNERAKQLGIEARYHLVQAADVQFS